MQKFDWDSVTKENVLEAIKIYLRDSPNCPAARSTFLLYDGKKLPAKHIRGMAYKVAYNKEISKEDYAGGMETVRFFEKLGFRVLHNVKEESSNNVDKLPKSENDEVDSNVKIYRHEGQAKVIKQNKNINYKNNNEDKIKIPSKDVIEQKNALQLILNKMFNGDIVCEKTFEWLKTPVELKNEYIELFNALKEYRGDNDFAKKNVVLRCDFVCESKKLIIEYDERQHFTQARKISLNSYKDIPLNYDRNLWIKACSDICAKDNQPANRDEVRAYYDSTRDIEAAKHGYTLVRIMHGQIDFTKPNAFEKLQDILPRYEEKKPSKNSKLKIAMYLQTDKYQCLSEFNKAIEQVKKTDADILVFPEFSWVPFNNVMQDSDISNQDDMDKIYDNCLSLSKQINKAVIIGNYDRDGTIYTVYANANANSNETDAALYIKHTQTNLSAFGFESYDTFAESLFSPIIYKDYKIGMTICYDCTFALFSAVYGVQGVNIIINSTGSGVVYDKLIHAVSEFAYVWYNQVRPHSYNGYRTPYEVRYEYN